MRPRVIVLLLAAICVIPLGAAPTRSTVERDPTGPWRLVTPGELNSGTWSMQTTRVGTDLLVPYTLYRAGQTPQYVTYELRLRADGTATRRVIDPTGCTTSHNL